MSLSLSLSLSLSRSRSRSLALRAWAKQIDQGQNWKYPQQPVSVWMCLSLYVRLCVDVSIEHQAQQWSIAHTKALLESERGELHASNARMNRMNGKVPQTDTDTSKEWK